MWQMRTNGAFLLCRYLIRTNLVQQVGCTAVCSPYILFIESDNNVKLERCLLCFLTHVHDRFISWMCGTTGGESQLLISVHFSCTMSTESFVSSCCFHSQSVFTFDSRQTWG